MDTQYLSEAICEELEGGINYMKLAIEERVSRPVWSKTFNEMAQTEYAHAQKLFNMLHEHIESLSTVYKDGLPDYIKEHREKAVNAMACCGGQIKALQDLYK